MNPYEKTSDEMKRQSEGPKKFAKGALGIGSSIAAASFIPILSRAAPLLSQYIPENLAIKGLSKISPKFGKFIQNAMDEGYDFKEVKDFIGQQINQSNEPNKDNSNIIEREAPELHQFISEEIKKGRKPLEAGALAYNNKKFTQAINKLKNSHKSNWADIIEMVYGKGDKALPSQQNAVSEDAMQPEGSQPIRPPSAEAQAAQNGNNQQQQPGQGQAALMQVLQKINQKLGS